MDAKEEIVYQVVFNHEEQYSIWEDGLILPKGWQKDGFSGLKEECLNYISEKWKDIRPRSLRSKQFIREGIQ